MVDVNETTRAREIAENLVWRLEVLQHRCRYNLKTGTYKQLPTRIRRFANARPTDLVASVIDELVKMAPYKGVVFCGEDDSDLSYRPTTTSIRKDDSLKSGSKDATYTVIQDLLLDGETDTYLGSDGSSCSQVSSVEYYWDEADVAACPDAEQGVIYQVADVSRDRETDLFSFKIRKTQAVTQHVAEHVVECSDDSQKTVETWDNVYGEVGGYRFDSVVHGGEAIEPPLPCESAQGTLVQVEVTDNPDCTFKIAVTRVTSKTDDSEFLRYRDQFQIRTSDLFKNQPERLSKNGVEYGGGIKTTYESSTNPDGTFNNRVTKETERPVSQSVYGVVVGTRYSEVSWTDANQPNAARGLPSGFQAGSYRSTKTPGGLYNNEFTGIRFFASSIGYRCSQTAFLHSHETVQTLASFPSVSSHVYRAGGGVVYSESVDRDDHGVITKRAETRAELPYKNFSRRVSSTLLGQTVEVRHRSQTSPLTDVAKGVVGSTEYQVTDGGRYDTVSRTFTAAKAGVKLGMEDARTVFEHVSSAETTSDEAVVVSSAGGGIYKKATCSVDPETGSIRSRVQTTEELPFSSAVVSLQGTARATIKTRTDRGLRSSAGASVGSVIEEGQQRKGETNAGGSIDLTTVTVTPRYGAKLSEENDIDVTQYAHTTESVGQKNEGEGTEKTGLTAGSGKYGQVTQVKDDNGVEVRRTRVVGEFNHVFGARVHEDALQAHQIIEATSAQVNLGALDGVGQVFSASEQRSDVGSETTLPGVASGVFSSANNQACLQTRGSAELAETLTKGKTVSGGGFVWGTQYVADSELTKGGNYHTRRYAYTPKPQKWKDAIVSKGNGGQYVWHFRNLSQAQCKLLVDDTLSAIQKNPYKDYACKPYVRRSMNEFGLYDGDIGFECREVSWAVSGGKLGDGIEPKAAENLYDWWEKDIRVKCLSSLDPNSSTYSEDENTRFLVQTRWSHYVCGYGVHKSALAAFMKSHQSAFWASVRINYNPSSQDFMYVYMKEQKTKVSYVEGSPPGSTDLLSDNATVNELGSPS